MIIFNPYWPYYLGHCIARINRIQGGQFLSSHVAEIADIRRDLEKFLEAEQHKILPNTCNRVKKILALLDELVPKNAPLIDRILIWNKDLQPLIEAVSEVGNEFVREAQTIHMIGLERQKALDLHILIEAVHKSYSKRAVRHFSMMTIMELIEAGRCLSFERYTATGFHMLRAVEREIRDYVTLLQHKTPRTRDWGSYIGILITNKADPKLVSALENMRDLDRNPVMHPEDFLDQDDAIGIFNLANVFLERLVADMERKQLLRPDDVAAPP